MKHLRDYPWQVSYDSDTDLVSVFYIPALERATQYDRSAGFFSASVFTIAARGVEGLVQNNGHMRLVVGAELREPEVEAVRRGEQLRDTVEAALLEWPLDPRSPDEEEALELLAWMVAKGYLEVRVAVPYTLDGNPIVGQAMFHDKGGVIEDAVGNRIAFVGSVNESRTGWTDNWESFQVFFGWEGGREQERVNDVASRFEDLWANRRRRCRVLKLPEAVKERFLDFAPKEGKLPRRLQRLESVTRDVEERKETTRVREVSRDGSPQVYDLRRLVWGLIRYGPALPKGGEWVGEATSAVTPWPHQVRAFQRLYENWPPKLLIADEVGLGKTIEAGLLLRQAWLSERAKRILILAPKAVLPQWQIELREKFNLNWPIYDGHKLSWYPCRALYGRETRSVDRDKWHREPCVIVSSQLMRRSDRAKELLEDAEPYDLVILDEAHHARRRGIGGNDARPNQLLRLMRRLKERTQGLVLLTATPMQVDPLEVWDLLELLGLPEEWTEENYLRFFDIAFRASPSHEEFEFLTRLFQATETYYGKTEEEEVYSFIGESRRTVARRILRALHDSAQIPRRQLEARERKAALALMRAKSPVGRLISRHTRGLLRQYKRIGKLDSNIAKREVGDEFVSLSPSERALYQAVEEYISNTYNRASRKERSAVGFVMTIYRRRLASSFAALERTLAKRLTLFDVEPSTVISEEDTEDLDVLDDLMDEAEATELEREALLAEERHEIESLLERVRSLSTDTKARVLNEILNNLRADGYGQVMVFTQYTDTMDFLREYLTQECGFAVLCFSGRGGERRSHGGDWSVVSRDEVKRVFREGGAEILLCTDAAAEGLNFQYCGAVVNYDMPWNPMRVEQRIGRIDRLGQKYETIRIVNLHYENTVETDVYLALRERINLFVQFVGKLQPILSGLSQNIREVTLAPSDERAARREELVERLGTEIQQASQSEFDLDVLTESDLELPTRPPPCYDLDGLDQILCRPDLLPPEIEVEPLGNREYRFLAPGISEAVRVTTSRAYFDQQPESVELWSPGSPVFPDYKEIPPRNVVESLPRKRLVDLLKSDQARDRKKAN